MLGVNQSYRGLLNGFGRRPPNNKKRSEKKAAKAVFAGAKPLNHLSCFHLRLVGSAATFDDIETDML